jgi:hypothetical protein
MGSFHPVGTVIGIVKVAVPVFEAMYIRRSARVVATFLCWTASRLSRSFDKKRKLCRNARSVSSIAFKTSRTSISDIEVFTT